MPEATNNFCTQEYLEEHDTIDFNSFVEKVWPNVREIYKSKEKAAEVIGYVIIYAALVGYRMFLVDFSRCLNVEFCN